MKKKRLPKENNRQLAVIKITEVGKLTITIPILIITILQVFVKKKQNQLKEIKIKQI